MSATIIELADRLKTLSSANALSLYQWVLDGGLESIKPILLEDLAIAGKRDKKLYPSLAVFQSCTGDYKMGPAEGVGMRALQQDRIISYLGTIPSSKARNYAKLFLSYTTYIPFTTFYPVLLASVSAALKSIGGKPYAILLDQSKYGSEWWLVQLLVQSGVFGDVKPVFITAPYSPSYPTTLLLIDDAIYSGHNLLSTIDSYTWLGDVEKRAQVDVHIAVPYISTDGHAQISSFMKEEKINTALYPAGGLLPSLLAHPEMKAFYPEGMLDLEIAEQLDLEPDVDFLPIYFDHKIAGRSSTATSILKAVVTPPPSRAAILRAETCYRSHL